MISLEEFTNIANKYYKEYQCQFTIYPTTWENLFKKLRSNTGLFNIDYVIKNRLNEDKYIYFRKADYQINLFKSNEQISKYILWCSDYFINRMKNSNALLIDGTFIKPFGFYQTLIIMFLDFNSDKFIPSALILLSNKSEWIYTESLYYKNKN